MQNNNNNGNDISSKLYNALKLKYKSEILAASATLEIYFNNCVGIGEHPQQLEEMDKLLSKMADNDDKMEQLEKNFSKYDEKQAGN